MVDLKRKYSMVDFDRKYSMVDLKENSMVDSDGNILWSILTEKNPRLILTEKFYGPKSFGQQFQF